MRISDWSSDVCSSDLPHKRLIADVNEAWDAAGLIANLPAMAAAGIDMLEQPLRAGADGALAGLDRPLPIGADASRHVAADVAGVVGDRTSVVWGQSV